VEDEAIELKGSKSTSGSNRSKHVLLERTSRWKQVGNYIPGRLDEESEEILASTSVGIKSKTIWGSKCIMCPGICECPVYLTEEQWRAKTVRIFCKA
jgi:hypothetical protein